MYLNIKDIKNVTSKYIIGMIRYNKCIDWLSNAYNLIIIESYEMI